MAGQLANRVLLVEDEPLLRKLISGNLLAAGYVVRTAEDGLDALTKLRAGLPDLIISDLNMPRMSGLEFFAVVRKRFPQIPFMVISSVPVDEMRREVAADAYYHKNGFGFQQLLETVSDLTRKPPLRNAPPPIDDGPSQARWDGNGQYIIGCKDCLREFNVPRTANIVRAENWTFCVHCGKLVQFIIAEHSESK